MATDSSVPFYDLPGVAERYLRLRDRTDDGNALIEEPHVLDLLGPVRDRSVVDLGCGDGRFGAWLTEQGCASYVGLDASRHMIELARARLASVPAARVEVGDISDWYPEPDTVDLVVARMALHYIRDLATVLVRISGGLTPGGRLVFSTEHPLITSDYTSASEDDVPRHWTVTNYFCRGPRTVRWLGKDAVKYHRTVEDYVRLVQESRLTIEQLREGEPVEGVTGRRGVLEHRRAVPITLIVSAVKPRNLG